jgi:gag-polypeptide of LTR copia-type
MATQPIKRIDLREFADFTTLSVMLNRFNWLVWKEQMIGVLDLCELLPLVVHGTVQKPNQAEQPEDYSNWKHNDCFVKCVICRNIEADRYIYIMRCDTSHDMWRSLVAVYEPPGFENPVEISRCLTQTRADEEEDIVEHIEQLKEYWEQLNMRNFTCFTMTDECFKHILSFSLPPSWDDFTSKLISMPGGIPPQDERANITSQEFIGILIQEAYRRKGKKARLMEPKAQDRPHKGTVVRSNGRKRPLAA